MTDGEITPLTISNLKSIAYHLRKGEDNGGLSREILASALTFIADRFDHSIDSARDKQREADAKIADGFAELTFGVNINNETAAAFSARNIAAAIRNQAKPRLTVGEIGTR